MFNCWRWLVGFFFFLFSVCSPWTALCLLLISNCLFSSPEKHKRKQKQMDIFTSLGEKNKNKNAWQGKHGKVMQVPPTDISALRSYLLEHTSGSGQTSSTSLTRFQYHGIIWCFLPTLHTTCSDENEALNTISASDRTSCWAAQVHSCGLVWLHWDRR